MSRFLLACGFVFVLLAIAPVANAETLLTYMTTPLPFDAWHTSHCDFLSGCQPSIQDAMPGQWSASAIARAPAVRAQ
jgi:hypothetical protein